MEIISIVNVITLRILLHSASIPRYKEDQIHVRRLNVQPFFITATLMLILNQRLSSRQPAIVGEEKMMMGLAEILIIQDFPGT